MPAQCRFICMCPWQGKKLTATAAVRSIRASKSTAPLSSAINVVQTVVGVCQSMLAAIHLYGCVTSVRVSLSPRVSLSVYQISNLYCDGSFRILFCRWLRITSWLTSKVVNWPHLYLRHCLKPQFRRNEKRFSWMWRNSFFLSFSRDPNILFLAVYVVPFCHFQPCSRNANAAFLLAIC